jgi:hypothetical protein
MNDDKKYIQHRIDPRPPTRNDTLEEVAQEFERMRIAFGDTAASFAQYVREMKSEE